MALIPFKIKQLLTAIYGPETVARIDTIHWYADSAESAHYYASHYEFALIFSDTAGNILFVEGSSNDPLWRPESIDETLEFEIDFRTDEWGEDLVHYVWPGPIVNPQPPLPLFDEILAQ